MNKSYISVWNEALGSWVAACENSKTRGKRGKSKAVSLMGAALLATSAVAPLAHAQYAAGSGFAEGPSSVAIGADSGNAAFAFGDSSTAVGSNAAATGVGSAAFGNDTSAVGTGSFAAGGGSHDGSTPGAIAMADWSVALGRSTVMYGATAGIAIGLNNTASAAGAVVMGSNSIASGSDSIAFGTGRSATAANSVALGSGSIADRENTVSVGSAMAMRQITNVAAGTQDSDAVVVSQLKGVTSALGGGAAVDADGSVKAPAYSVGGTTVDNVGDAFANVDARTTQNTANIQNIAGDVMNITNGLDNGTIGLVQQDATSRDISVAKDADGSVINVAGTAGNRTVTGVAAGAVRASSVDAVNGGQLYGTASSTARALGGGSIVLADGSISAPKFIVGGTTVYSVAEAVTNLDGRTTQNTGDIALNATDIAKNTSNIEQNASSITSVQNQLSEGTVGLVQQDATSRDITVAKDADGSVINVAGTAGNRTVTGVAAGAVRASSVDAVNGGQLYGTASSTARALGGGSIVLADGSISAPKFSVGGTTVYSVAEAVTNLDGRTTQNAGDIAQNATNIASVQNQLSEGTVGLVQQDANTRDITVAKDMDGTVVNVAGAAGNRTVTGVANGAVNASSVDAINGGQLYGAASSTAEALGGGSTVNADGTLSAPSYSVGGTTVRSVGDAVTNLDGRTTQNTEDITKLQTQVGDVGTQLSAAVQYDRRADGSVNFGAVTLGGGQSTGPVILTNVANGTSQYDAVNYGQLSALQNQVTDLNGQVWNLGSQMSNLQPGNSVSEAEDASSSGASNDVVVNVATPGTGAGSTTAGAGAAASGNYATVIGASANAAADNAVAVGANAAATGASSTAIGTGSQAANANSVALGQGSVTDRDNSVSVGSATQQRQITNVAAGTADTDAVNVGQMNSSVAQGVQQANNYTDMRFNDLNSTIDSIAKKSYSGSAAAIATANLPQAPAAGKSIVAVAGGTYAGQSAVAVGLSTFTRNGKWIIKASGSTTTAGSFAVGAGAGFVF
ncbi:autotransporter adhesin [Paraburkholderia youngii]|uniref:YadA-like family protein n=1 Tax=Paraburkholderia youngii TaxID=2782701 RepID=UPI003D1F7735